MIASMIGEIACALYSVRYFLAIIIIGAILWSNVRR